MTDAANSYPGERLGLPAQGPGSIGRIGRRIAALLIDYTAATVIAMAFLAYDPWALPYEAGWRQFAPMIVFAVIQILFLPTAAAAPGTASSVCVSNAWAADGRVCGDRSCARCC